MARRGFRGMPKRIEVNPSSINEAAIAVAFGRRLREARKAADMTQTELGERIGSTKAAICRWENGTNTPNLGTVTRLAAALRTEAFELMPSFETIVEVQTEMESAAS